MSDKKIAALEKRLSSMEKRFSSLEKQHGEAIRKLQEALGKSSSQELEKKIKAEGKEAQKRGAELVLALQKKQREEAGKQSRDMTEVVKRMATKQELEVRFSGLEAQIKSLKNRNG